ncbi:MAG: CPBP family intramembrane glutamic endopeptidase [Cyanobacteriota bacterium]
MDLVIVGTIKLIVVLLILAIIARIDHDHPFDQPFFEQHRWTLNDAYKILIPVLSLTYLQFILHCILAQHTLLPQLLTLISAVIYCVTILTCYYWFIQKPFGVGLTDLGLDKAKSLRSGIRNANIALVFLLFTAWVGELSATSSQNTHISPAVLAYMLTLLLVVLVTPILEELLFRGVLYSPVARKLGAWKAICLLSLVTALLHLHYGTGQTLFQFVFGLLLYYSYKSGTSLYGPIVWHITANFYFNRFDIGKVLAPLLDASALGRYYVYGFLFVLLMINAFWVREFLTSRKLQEPQRNFPV